MVVTVTHDGYIKRLPPSTYRAQGRGGRGIAATNTKEGDFLEHMFVALTHDYILFFTDNGKVYWLKVYDLPRGDPDRRRPGDRQPAPARRRRADHRPGPGPRVPRGRVPVHGHPPRDGQEDRADGVQAAPGPRDHRPGAGRGRRADRRGPDQGGRPRRSSAPRKACRSGSTSRGSARWAGPPTASRGSTWPTATRSSAWSWPTATTTRPAS